MLQHIFLQQDDRQVDNSSLSGPLGNIDSQNAAELGYGHRCSNKNIQGLRSIGLVNVKENAVKII